MKKIIVILAVLAAVAFGAYKLFGGKGGEEGPGQKPAQEVSVIKAEIREISGHKTLPGRLTPYRQSEVRPQVDGVITARLFEEGSNVNQGQQLYQIDDARYKASYNSAIADLKSAEANVKSVDARAKRYQELVAINAVSKQEYDDAIAQANQAVAAVAVAQAAVDVAKVNLDYTKVYAPISGKIGRSLVTEGTLVTANQAQNLATITQLDPIYVDMQQSGTGPEMAEMRAQFAGKSIPVNLTIDNSEGGKAYGQGGVLKFSEVTVDETTASIALRAEFPNPDATLLPGMFVRASLDLGAMQALTVPQRATARNPQGQLTIWTVDAENKAKKRTISATQAYEDQWIVTDGLQPGETVIVEGYQKVQEDAVVTPVPLQAEGEQAAQDKPQEAAQEEAAEGATAPEDKPTGSPMEEVTSDEVQLEEQPTEQPQNAVPQDDVKVKAVPETPPVETPVVETPSADTQVPPPSPAPAPAITPEPEQPAQEQLKEAE
jgi:membrane fusion protein (multidrug efflux system)